MSRAIFKSTTVVGVTTLLSRVTGLLRDMVYSQAFGAGTLMDAFLVAFKIPNFLRRLFAEGAFSQSFVPVISEYKVRREQAEVRELVGGVFGTLGGRAVRGDRDRRDRRAADHPGCSRRASRSRTTSTHSPV